LKHRRTHSAPPGTYIRSPKLTPRHRTINEAEGQESEGDVSTTRAPKTPRKLVNSENEKLLNSPKKEKKNKVDKLDAIKSSLKETLKMDSSPFKLFRSRTPTGTHSTLTKSDSFPMTRHNKTNSEGNLPSLCVNGEFIEVMLDDDDVKALPAEEKMQNGSLLSDDMSFESRETSNPLVNELIPIAAQVIFLKTGPAPHIRATKPLLHRKKGNQPQVSI